MKDGDWVKDIQKKVAGRCRICRMPKVLKRRNELLAAIEKANATIPEIEIGRKLMKEFPAFRCAENTYRAAVRKHREICNDWS